MPSPADPNNQIRRTAIDGEHRDERQLVLECARTEVSPAVAGRIRALAQKDLDWPYVRTASAREFVLPLVYRSLRDTCADQVPPELLDQMRGQFHRSALLVQMRADELETLVDEFSRADLPVISFKGPLLGAMVYGNQSFRKPGDLDLLIRSSDYSEVKDLLATRGYEPKVEPDVEEEHLKYRQSVTFAGGVCEIDLHWSLHHPGFGDFPLSFSLKPDEIWAVHSTVTFNGRPIQTLSPEHLLLYLCSHGAKHSWTALYLICDIAEITRSNTVDWERALSIAEEIHLERMLLLGLMLADRLIGIDVPRDVRGRFEEMPAVHELSTEVTEWLFNPSARYDKVDHTRFRLKLLDTPFDRFKYLGYRGLRKILP